jgi:hypothetical protein
MKDHKYRTEWAAKAAAIAEKIPDAKMQMALATAPASVGPASASQQANLPGGQQGSAAATANTTLPFTSSARRHREQMAIANAVVPAVGTGFAASQIPEQSIPAYGFLRGLWLRAVAAGGTGTGAVAAADAPLSTSMVVTLMALVS